MINELGMPYMGGKRKLAKPILDYICFQNPKAKFFYDLFGGGGAISFNAVQRKQFERVNYNELNTGVVELLKKLRLDGVTKDMYKWVDRETFNAHKKDNDWYGGLLKTCWSFGNNQSGYLFGKDIEEPKRLMHEVVVNCCEKSAEKLPFKIDNLIFNLPTINERRLALRGMVSERIDLQQLQQLQQLEQLERLQQLEQLEQLERLERLQQLQRLNITNLSYEAVQIETPINETIIYCDPPYKGTHKYAKDINHDIFYNWVKNHPCKVYVSSYDFNLPIVLELAHRSILSATANNKVVERLFCNRLEKFETNLTLF
jgi:16S rRNA G966 N2-methylase RsmD